MMRTTVLLRRWTRETGWLQYSLPGPAATTGAPHCQAESTKRAFAKRGEFQRVMGQLGEDLTELRQPAPGMVGTSLRKRVPATHCAATRCSDVLCGGLATFIFARWGKQRYLDAHGYAVLTRCEASTMAVRAGPGLRCPLWAFWRAGWGRQLEAEISVAKTHRRRVRLHVPLPPGRSHSES